VLLPGLPDGAAADRGTARRLKCRNGERRELLDGLAFATLAHRPPHRVVSVSGASRAKGVRGEHEVAAIWEAHGFTVRGLEGGGDHLCITTRSPTGYIVDVATGERLRDTHALTIHSEVKRQERLQLWQWIAQAEAEAPPGAVPVVAFRRNRSPWYGVVRLDTLAERLG